MPVWIHALLLLSSFSAAAGQILLKQGATGRSALIAFINPWVGGGLALYGVGTMIWIFALSRAPLTLVYPYTALTFVLVYLTGVLFFGEAAPRLAVVGVGRVLLGLLLINLGGARR